MQIIRDFINKTFRDEMTGVEQPREWWIKYKDVGERLEGYIVTVHYKYRGQKDRCFDIDNDHFQIVSKIEANNNAWDFYFRTLDEIEKRNSEKITRKYDGKVR